MEASLAMRENTPQRRNSPIEFEQRRRHINVQRLGGFEVDDELQLLVGNSTGRSAGFSPFRILSTLRWARRSTTEKEKRRCSN
jgi:hypothetical protein